VGNLKAKVNGAIAKAAAKVGVSWVLAQVRAAARGDYGPEWKARYQTASDLAPWTGFGFAIFTVGLAAGGQTEAALWVGSVTGVLIAAGVVNAAYLTEMPVGLKNSAFYKQLVSWAPITTIVLTTLWAGLEACTDPKCAKERTIVLILAAVAAKFGLVDAAWQAKPPAGPTAPKPPAPLSP
jgi:hypothetical protein